MLNATHMICKNSADRDRLNTFVRRMYYTYVTFALVCVCVCMHVDACARMQLERIAWYT